MTFSLRAVAVIAVPLLTMACSQPFSEAPSSAETDEPQLEVIPHAGTPADRHLIVDQVTCKTGDTWSSLTVGLDEKGLPTRLVMKLGGKDGTAHYSGELIADVDRVTQLGEAEVRIDIARKFVSLNFERNVGGGLARPAREVDVRAITIGRQADSGMIRLETPIGQDLVTNCDENEAVAVGAVARKLIAAQQ
jgi:hypothetical protein